MANGIPSRPPAHLHHRRRGRGVEHEVGVDRPGPLGEQHHRVARRPRQPTRRQRQGTQRPHVLAGDAQALPAGGQHPHPRRAGQDRLGQLGGGVEQMLTVVQHHQHLAGPQEVDDRLGQAHLRALDHPQGDRHHLGQLVAAGRRGQLAQPRPVGEARQQLGRHLQRQAGLAHPADPGQRHQPGVTQLLGHRGQLHLAAHERTGQRRQIPRQHVQRPQRRERRPRPTWNTRIGRSRSRRRCSPRSTNATASPTSSAVADEHSTCPPWPTAISRAARFTAVPK